MRYIHYKTVVTKPVDEFVKDDSTIRAILLVIKDKELDCSIQLLDWPRWPLCRILNVHEHVFECKVISNHRTLIKTAAFQQIDRLDINTVESEIIALKPRITRWFLLAGCINLADELDLPT